MSNMVEEIKLNFTEHEQFDMWDDEQLENVDMEASEIEYKCQIKKALQEEWPEATVDVSFFFSWGVSPPNQVRGTHFDGHTNWVDQDLLGDEISSIMSVVEKVTARTDSWVVHDTDTPALG